MLRGVYVGHHERSGAATFLTPDGVKRRTRIAIMLEHERWDRVFSASCIGVPWQLRLDQRNLARPLVPVAEAYTDECQACTRLALGMHRRLIFHNQFNNQFPTVRVGGSASSGTRAGSGSRANETNTDDRERKRVRFTESRGQKRQAEDVEELAAKSVEQHLDANVEVLAHKTWRVEDFAGGAADAAPKQMNSFVQSKTEVFEKIEESLRPLCMVEDLNDDEIMELLLSNDACETTAILNRSKFASCATRLGHREGFAVDLTTARANGTMWDLSLEDDRAEIRRVQNREQPEFLAGSPPSDDFSSLLNTCVETQEISKLKTERSEQLCTSLQATYGNAQALRS